MANLPGWVLKNGLRETWGVVGGAWMQHDDQVEALGIQWILDQVPYQILETGKYARNSC